MSSYATLAQSESDLKFNGLNPTASEVVSGKQYLIDALEFVSARIDQICGQEFAPRIELRPYDSTQRYIDWWRNQLILDRPILEPLEVKVADVTLSLWNGVYADKFSSDYTVYPYGVTPATALQGLTRNVSTWIPLQFAGFGPAYYLGAITVRAIWGFRTRYDEEGWLASGNTVLDNPLSSSATTITVTSAALFSPGMLLRLEDEYVSVSAVTDSVADTLTVVRGVRGSTAVAHVVTTPIEIWYPEPNIVRATLRWANYLYQRRAVYETTTINAAGTYASVFPPDVPPEAWAILQQYVNIQSARV